MGKENDKKKLHVVGWTDYDNLYYPPCENITDEVFDAVAEEVREHEFLFGGDSHQDYSDCCPVLSDGRRVMFSWRGWGAVIAAAYDIKGANGKLDHMSGYMDMMIRPDAIRRPKGGVNRSAIDDGSKTYELTLPECIDDMSMGWRSFYVCEENEVTKQIKPYDYVNLSVFICKGTDGENVYSTYEHRVIGITHIKSLDEAYEWAKNYTRLTPDFGFGDDLEKEEVFEKIYQYCPKSVIESGNAVCFALFGD